MITQSQNAPTDYDNFPTFQFYHEASHCGYIEENILQMLQGHLSKPQVKDKLNVWGISAKGGLDKLTSWKINLANEAEGDREISKWKS